MAVSTENAAVCKENAGILMLERLSEKFAKKLIRAGVISESDADVYVYGFFQTIMLLLNVATTLLLGVLFQRLILCILLNLAYIPIRISAGGYHASSPMKCYISSTAIIAILLAVLKWVTIPAIPSIIILVVSGLIIWCLAPVETETEPLDEIECTVYKKRTRIACIVEAAIFICLLCFAGETYAAAIALGVWTEALMLLIGVCKNHFTK